MAKKKTEPKVRASKYDAKLAINATFEDVIKIAVGKKPINSNLSENNGDKK